jgi:hypothetical protein
MSHAVDNHKIKQTNKKEQVYDIYKGIQSNPFVQFIFIISPYISGSPES